MKRLALLLTCYNRVSKTLLCLEHLFNAEIPTDVLLDVYLVDDNSPDQTGKIVKEKYPQTNIIPGSGNLFWAGGMRLAWQAAMSTGNYDFYLLLNDDVELKTDFLENLFCTYQYSLEKLNKKCICIGSTADPVTKECTYGGQEIIRNGLVLKFKAVKPSTVPKQCHFANANIMLVDSSIVSKIGLFDEKFTHGIADFDYTYRASQNNIPVLITAGICGFCGNDHGVNWKNSQTKLRERIAYLKSPKGLAYTEYLYYIHKNFPLYLPYAFIMLWLKTLFPIIWEKFK